ncbi:MAG TPA: hypothetical protein VII24_14240 [Pseudolabrys sp.]
MSVAANISHAVGIETAVALRAVVDRLLPLRRIRDHSAENQTADYAGSDRAATATAAAVTAAAAMTAVSVLHLQ